MSSAQREEEARFHDVVRRLSVRTFPGNRDGFDRELQALAKVDQRVRSNLDEFHTASLGSSMAKNRFDEVKPNEQTIVRLHPLSDCGTGTYINANYVDAREAMGTPFVYIATQAPMKNTILDFWRMVYENDCAFIVMLCAAKENGKVKSEVYWPVKGQVYDWGLLSVTTISENVRSNSVHRTLLLRTVRGDEKEVYHMQYLNWPDQGVPTSSAPLMEMMQSMGKSQRSVESPIVVHCSGGIGRTGVFIGLHIALAEFQLEHKNIRIPRIVRFLKLCRSGMVQRKDQYLYLYFSTQREMERMLLSAQHRVNLLDSRPRENLAKQTVVQRTNLIPPPALPSGPEEKSLWSRAGISTLLCSTFGPGGRQLATNARRAESWLRDAGNDDQAVRKTHLACPPQSRSPFTSEKYEPPGGRRPIHWSGSRSSSQDGERLRCRPSEPNNSKEVSLVEPFPAPHALANWPRPPNVAHPASQSSILSTFRSRSELENELVRVQHANRLKRMAPLPLR